MRVIGERGAARQQATRLQAAARALGTLATVTAALAVGGWLRLIWQSVVAPTAWPAGAVGVVGVLSLAAVLLPRWHATLDAQARAAAAALAGAQRFEATVAELLDSDWLLLIAPPAADSVLIGPHGLYALILIVTDITQRNAGTDWQQRTPDGQWAPLADNPTARARSAAERLTHRLAAHDAALAGIAAQPRIVWAGRGLLLQEEPALPIWHLGQVDTLLADLFGRPRLTSDQQQAALAALTHAPASPALLTPENAP